MDRDQRRLKEWIVGKRLQGCSISDICAQARIGRDMFYRWWNRYRTEGKLCLEEKPKGRPRSIFVDDSVKIKIVKLRKRYGWGPSKMAGHLNHKGFCIVTTRFTMLSAMPT